MMQVYVLPDTRDTLGRDLCKCESRSLFLDRFAVPHERDGNAATPRKDWFAFLIQKRASAPVLQNWIPSRATLLYGQLKSRLIVDMASGVMENAGTSLDRYGVPIIPGSAIKGAARRMAMQALHDWIAAGTDRPKPNDVVGPSCESFVTPAEMLAAIALVFGWTQQDWQPRQTKSDTFSSDLRWASGTEWRLVWKSAFKVLASHMHLELRGEDPWTQLPEYSGSVAFLPARPSSDPGLELDVVTPHHTEYYSSNDTDRKATDTESPVPVSFPTVKPQKGSAYFTFPLVPLRNLSSQGNAVDYAKTWLKEALSIFGIGAKTNSGYGWFDTSDALQNRITQTQEAARTEADKERTEKIKRDTEREIQIERNRAKIALAQALEGLSLDEQEDKRIELLNEAQFDAKVRSFCRSKGGLTEGEKAAVIRALRGPRLAYWQSFKGSASRGKLAEIVQAIHTLNKQLNKSKMP